MYQKQLKSINMVLIVIVVILMINLVIDLMPYMIIAKIIGSIFGSGLINDESEPLIKFYSKTMEPGKEGPFFSLP